ncbi:OLC1v1037248C1 [Oldenlandia corymbosa var. corymbosa]|uniref:OLC1v1037248C1 n=1 Tax=Oldenlandia corymbosa var. corymbosa TaxID=529605 RepID=A0AAV1CZV7_OLDCO|nr:OLC1v1037248C1 [Oldenlandia corymbosa var. corymbosa]
MAEETPNHTQIVSGWAAHDTSGFITPYVFKRRENGIDDVTIQILYCGMCHTDLHFIKNEWNSTIYPIVPGHEITGIVTKVGSNVTKFKIGDKVGVGCLAATCLECEHCKDSQENYCDQLQLTYSNIFWDGSITYGGYSDIIVSDQRYVVHIPDNLPMDAAAPLLCAGITTYCPLKNEGLLEKDSFPKRVGVVGLGGLGHMAVKFAKAFGHHVTVISTSPSKELDAKQQLGADDFVLSTNPEQMQARRKTLDFIVNTATASHSIGPFLELLKVNGTLVVVGLPVNPIGLPPFPLAFGKRVVKGSLIGSIKETEEMLEVCRKHNIVSDIEIIQTTQINEAFKRLESNDNVKYRFVVDIAAGGQKHA